MPAYALQGTEQVIVLGTSSTEKETQYLMASLDLETFNPYHIWKCYFRVED